MSTTTTVGRFTVTTNPADSQARTSGRLHWDFTITSQSGAAYSGLFSSGDVLSGEHLARDVLQAVAIDAEAAWPGGGDMGRQLGHLADEGLGYGLLEGYRAAQALVAMWPFLQALTDEEVNELEALAHND